MRQLTSSIYLLAAVASCSSALAAQARHPIGTELILGVAQRSENRLILPTDGVQAAARAALPVVPGLRLLGAASWASFGDQSRNTPSYCPAPGPCSGAPASYPGLGMASLGAGLQALLPLGTFELRLSGTSGGYWLYHHPVGVASLAPGVEGGAALGLPIGTQLHLLLEGRLVHVAGSAGRAANSRRIGFGVAFH